MSLRQQLDVRHPIFRPLWRRVLVVALILAWIVYDVIHGNWLWVAGFGAAVGYLIYEWFVVFDPKEYGDTE